VEIDYENMFSFDTYCKVMGHFNLLKIARDYHFLKRVNKIRSPGIEENQQEMRQRYMCRKEMLD
jgi:hypothetical protein